MEASGAWLSCVAGVPGIPSLPAAPLPFFKGEAARPRVEAGEARRLDPGALAAFVPPLPFNGEAARMIVDMESFCSPFGATGIHFCSAPVGQCSFKKVQFCSLRRPLHIKQGKKRRYTPALAVAFHKEIICVCHGGGRHARCCTFPRDAVRPTPSIVICKCASRVARDSASLSFLKLSTHVTPRSRIDAMRYDTNIVTVVDRVCCSTTRGRSAFARPSSIRRLWGRLPAGAA